MNTRPPLPPFTRESAIEKSGWQKMAGTAAIRRTLRWPIRWIPNGATVQNSPPTGRKRRRSRRGNGKELDYRLIKELWAFTDNRIAVRYAYEWHDDSGNWFRSYGNENWEFAPDGLMKRRFACVNDMPIKESERLFHWPLGRRPDDHPR